MARLAGVVGAQWKTQWRRLSRKGDASKVGSAVFLLSGCLLLPEFFRLLSAAAVELPAGDTSGLELLLGAIFFAWAVPVLTDSRMSLRPASLQHLPLSSQELFAFKIISLMMQPAAWIVAAASVALCYPILFAAHPARGIVTVLCFVVMSVGMNVTLAHVLNTSVGRAMLLIAGVISLTLIGWQLSSGVPMNREVAGLGELLPYRLAAQAAVSNRGWIGLVGIAGAAVCTCVVAWASFKANPTPTRRRASRKVGASLIDLPGAFGGLAAKEFRYLRRLLDAYLGSALGVLIGFYLLAADAPSRNVLRAALVAIFLTNASAAFNSFGFDTKPELDRYVLLPLRGREIIFKKNVAFLMLVGAQICLPLALTFWRFGTFTGATALLESVALACAFTAWGNVSSIKQPYEMQPYRFSSGGSPFDALVGVTFGSAPGLALVIILREESVAASSVATLLTLFCVGLYLYSLAWAGKLFEQRRG